MRFFVCKMAFNNTKHSLKSLLRLFFNMKNCWLSFWIDSRKFIYLQPKILKGNISGEWKLRSFCVWLQNQGITFQRRWYSMISVITAKNERISSQKPIYGFNLHFMHSNVFMIDHLNLKLEILLNLDEFYNPLCREVFRIITSYVIQSFVNDWW